MSVLIYIEKITPRLSYICDLVFEQYFGVKYEFTLDKDKYFQCNLPRINYSRELLSESDFFIEASEILIEQEVVKKDIEVFRFENLPVFFGTTKKNVVFPFDIFAAIFYLVSRYEEYLPFEPDEHGRFSAKDSLAYQAGFLQLPLVDLWIQLLRRELSNKFPKLIFKQAKYQFQPTYDVDMAWSYLEKGGLRAFGASVNDVLRMDLNRVVERFLVRMGKKKDPFDVFDYLDKLTEEYQLKDIYFFLVGKYGKYDKNISPTNSKFQHLVKKIRDEGAFIGVHPSYAGGSNVDSIKHEINNLQKIIGDKVTRSRHHFLKFVFPKTFRLLIDAGIEVDYSLGYADEIGFRASIARSFYWYDLEREQQTKLKLLPFHVMDVTLREYLKLSPEEAVQEVKMLIDSVKKVDGIFVSLWHNSSFSESDGWKGWKEAYEEILGYAH